MDWIWFWKCECDVTIEDVVHWDEKFLPLQGFYAPEFVRNGSLETENNNGFKIGGHRYVIIWQYRSTKRNTHLEITTQCHFVCTGINLDYVFRNEKYCFPQIRKRKMVGKVKLKDDNNCKTETSEIGPRYPV